MSNLSEYVYIKINRKQVKKLMQYIKSLNQNQPIVQSLSNMDVKYENQASLLKTLFQTFMRGFKKDLELKLNKSKAQEDILSYLNKLKNAKDSSQVFSYKYKLKDVKYCIQKFQKQTPKCFKDLFKEYIIEERTRYSEKMNFFNSINCQYEDAYIQGCQLMIDELNSKKPFKRFYSRRKDLSKYKFSFSKQQFQEENQSQGESNWSQYFNLNNQE